jgi:hypothetical protein
MYLIDCQMVNYKHDELRAIYLRSARYDFVASQTESCHVDVNSLASKSNSRHFRDHVFSDRFDLRPSLLLFRTIRTLLNRISADPEILNFLLVNSL